MIGLNLILRSDTCTDLTKVLIKLHMQPMLLLSSTCINLRHRIVDTSRGSERLLTIVKMHPMVIELTLVWEEGLRMILIK